MTGRSADVIAAYYVDLIRQHSTAVSEVLKKFQFLDLLDSLTSSKTRAQEHDCKLSFASTVSQKRVNYSTEARSVTIDHILIVHCKHLDPN